MRKKNLTLNTQATTEQVVASVIPAVERVSSPTSDSTNQSEAKTPSLPSTYHGIPYTLIVKHLENLLGGVPEHGSRNNHIFAMACHLRYLCNHDADWVINICPIYGEAPSKAHTTIRSACNRAQGLDMPDVVVRALSLARTEYQLTLVPAGEESDIEHLLTHQPPMPKVLPSFVRDAIAPFPDYQKPAMALACFTPLMSYFSGTRIRYIDNTWLEPSSMYVLVGGAGKGKNGHGLLVKSLLQQMDEQDAINEQRDKEWREQDQQLADNRKHPARPKDICFQNLCSDVTPSALTQRQGDCERAGGKFIYSYFSEASKLKGVASDLSDLINTAYDCEKRGAARSSSKGESGNYPLRWNFSVSCNKTVLYKTFNFRQALYDGTLQRITFGILPEQKPSPSVRGRDLVPRYGEHDKAYADRLRQYTEKISRVKGDYESPEELTELSLCRCDDKYEIFQNTGDTFIDEYANRTIAAAHKIGFTLWQLNDCVWNEVDSAFVEWCFWYEMWARCVILRHPYYEMVEGTTIQTNGLRGPRNMLLMLRNHFTISDLQQVRRQEGKSIDEEDIRHQLSVWKDRGHIRDAEGHPDEYEKLNYRSQISNLN